MEQMIDLKDLLKHEIRDLSSAEQQIIEALPSMIEKARNGKLKTALEDHLKVTKDQKKRLEEIQQLMGEGAETGENDKSRGLFSRLFGGEEKCKGMEGLIDEGKKIMATDMSPEASDAAIIAAAQKIEHYEISGYGTARAYARELNLGEVAHKLEQTLNEEYAADDLLTELAVGKLNVEAEFANSLEGENGGSKQRQKKSNGSSNANRVSARSNGSGRSRSRSNGNGSVKRKAPASKPASKSSSSKSSSKGRASLRKTSASNGRGTTSKNVSKSKGGSRSNLTRSNSKVAASKRSASKTSGRSKSSRGR